MDSAPRAGPAQRAHAGNSLDRLRGTREAIIARLGDEAFEQGLQVYVGVRQLGGPAQ